MKSISFDRFGGPDVLNVAEDPAPKPGPGQILIDVDHAGINFAEVMFRRGQISVDLPHTPGLEVVGTVVATGTEPGPISIGDRVAALTLGGGGQAELALADTDKSIKLDGRLSGLDGASTAAILCNATTAIGAIALSGRPHTGDRVLITAAAGGVGRCLLDLLQGEDLTLVAVTSDLSKLGELTSDTEAVTYDELADAEDFDVIFDTIGGPVRKLLRDKTRLLGRHVIMGDAANDDLQIDCDSIWFGCTTLVGYNLGAIGYSKPDLLREHMRQALTHLADGRIRAKFTEIGANEVREAHTRLEQRTSCGKYVLTW
ncbi:zinc-binding alcohol dehydrogenase family protein [Williamsia sp.]|uniref:quinone oxidoreductase family protein n=1 Tax=Williamsia sp. TaxID=1872085 RepID=UPI002F942039